MIEEHEYSKEWMTLFESALTYQEHLKFFFHMEEKTKLRDLRRALRDRKSAYHALNVIEKASIDIIRELLDDLIYHIIYGNTSTSYMAKKIVLVSNRSSLREDICKIVFKYSEKEKEDVLIMSEIAHLLYKLEYKTELIEFVNRNMAALKQAEFIETDDDLKDIYEMEDYDSK